MEGRDWAQSQTGPVEDDSQPVPITDETGRFVIAYRYRRCHPAMGEHVEFPVLSMAEARRNA